MTISIFLDVGYDSNDVEYVLEMTVSIWKMTESMWDILLLWRCRLNR